MRIFVSSPGDVGEERVMTERVVQRLQGEFGQSVKLEAILWEHEPMRATQHPQEQIPLPSECDIVVCLLWSRLGTRLPYQISAAGKTGTEWEFEEAARSFLEKKTPDLLVYRKTKEVLASVHDDVTYEEKKNQWNALSGFLAHWFKAKDGTFNAVFKTFEALDQFEELLERDLRKLIQDRLKLTPHAERTWHHAPFRGLEVFDYEHAPIFFGRTRAIGAIREALVQQAAHGCAFVLVFGMSGVGKSSLVRAGVLPTITRPGVIEGVGLWRWCVFRPSDATGDLCDGLASGLMAAAALPELAEAGVDARALAKLLREAPDQAALPMSVGLKRAAETTAAAERLLKPPVTRLALVVDQMEELFSSDRVTEPQRIGFVQALSALARSGHVWIIGAMRSDFYPRCAEVPELAALKAVAGQFDLLPPTAPQLAQMIGDPARAAGLRFEEKPTGERLDHVLQETALRDPQALPLLEFTLAELYKLCSKDRPPSEAVVLTFAAYDQLGGMEGALARRAEEEFAKLSANVQAALPAVFRALVTVRQGEDEAIVAQPVLREVFAAAADQDALVEAFIQARLFVSDRTSVEQKAMVRLAHEALLRCWPRLVQWLAANREFLHIRARVSEEAKRWQSEGQLPELLLAPGKPLVEGEFLLAQKQELDRGVADYIQQSRQIAARSRRRRRIIFAAFVLSLLVGTVFSSFFAWQANQNAEAEAKTQQKRALAQVDALRDAAPGGVPGILADLEANRATVLPQLRARFAEESERAKRMRLALALLPIEPDEMRDELVAWMLQTKDPAETLLVRDALRPHSAELTGNVWHQAVDPARPRAERFRALVALASFDPASPRWKKVAPDVAEELLTANSLHLGSWVQALHPVRLSLQSPLGETFRGERLPAHRQEAAAVLADFAADQPQVLADLLMDADEKQFAVIFPKLKEHGDRSVAGLLAEFDKQAVAVKDKTIFESKETIVEGDAKVKTESGPLPAKRFEVRLQSGKAYRLTMESQDLNSFLVLQDKTGKELAYDDVRGNLNSLLLFTAPTKDTYTVFAASFKGTGSFVLKVVETMSGHDGKENLAKRQANAAVALLRMKREEKVWPLLKHSPDPRLRSYLIHRLSPLGADANAIIKRLDDETDITIRRALLLTLGEFGDEKLPPEDRQGLTVKLQAIYRTDADPGLHAASEWLLRTWKQDDWLRKVNDEWAKDKEAQQKRLEGIEQLLAKEKEKTPPQWYVNGQGQTMVVIPGPVEFVMGSPLTEAGRFGYEAQHKRRIGRTFAAAKSVTVEQYRQFYRGYTFSERYAPTPDCPVVSTSWYQAAVYCNWLSKEEGIDPKQWCYEIKGDPRLAENYLNPRLRENYLSLSGYRLPTEAEMEFATRAGAMTSRYYGETEELLGKYGWFFQNAGDRSWPVGSKKPNDLGFFDMHGNVWCWGQDRYLRYPTGMVEDKDKALEIKSTVSRVLRGGSFNDQASNVRTANRNLSEPTFRWPYYGFRVARTLPLDSFTALQPSPEGGGK
jgi:formylglycine-generating enzyme required for sulfatase activity